MANLKELRNRQKSIAATHKLTSAMMMVSRAKFAKTQSQYKECHSTYHMVQEWTGRALAAFQEEQEELESLLGEAPLQLPRMLRAPAEEPLPILLIVCTSDKGLSGGFNQALVHKAAAFLHEQEQQGQVVQLMCVGKRGMSLVQKAHRREVLAVFAQKSAVSYDEIHPILEAVFSKFHDGHVGRCYMLSASFKNALVQEPRIVQFLPQVVQPHAEGDLLPTGLLEYGSTPYTVLSALTDLLCRSHFYVLMQEHVLCEHNARMTAMNSATENAKELMETLGATYNHLRQSIITEELIEIISGAESL